MAWNGGGSANYTKIVSDGGYKAGVNVEDRIHDVEDRVHNIIEQAEHTIQREMGAIYSEIKDAVSA